MRLFRMRNSRRERLPKHPWTHGNDHVVCFDVDHSALRRARSARNHFHARPLERSTPIARHAHAAPVESPHKTADLRFGSLSLAQTARLLRFHAGCSPTPACKRTKNSPGPRNERAFCALLLPSSVRKKTHLVGDNAMKWVRGMALATVTAVMVLAGFIYLASLNDEGDYTAAYGPNAG